MWYTKYISMTVTQRHNFSKSIEQLCIRIQERQYDIDIEYQIIERKTFRYNLRQQQTRSVHEQENRRRITRIYYSQSILNLHQVNNKICTR